MVSQLVHIGVLPGAFRILIPYEVLIVGIRTENLHFNKHPRVLIQVGEGPSYEVTIWLVDLANFLELM